jgi:hypothetical protein
MTRYRNALPQLSGSLFLIDGAIKLSSSSTKDWGFPTSLHERHIDQIATACLPLFRDACRRSARLGGRTRGPPLGLVGAITAHSPKARYPAQHESCVTSLVKVCAQSLNPSTMVR